MKVLGLIPARGGSKGVPRKNVRPLGGVPLIGRAILAAQASTRIDAIVTSTEDAEIGAVAETFGSRVITRPPDLAVDETPMLPVAFHALDTMAAEGLAFDVLALLQPTSPFRTAEDIDTALSILEKTGCDAVIGVHQVDDAHPARMYTHESDYMESLDPKWETANRQDLPKVYQRNGNIYALRCDALRRERTFVPARSIPYVVPRERSVNIDEEFDFLLAEFLVAHKGSNAP